MGLSAVIRRLILALALAAGVVPAFAQAPPPVPALPDTERRQSYSISGTTCACNVNFALYGDSTDFNSWVQVWLNGVNVAASDPNFGWTITSPTGPLSTIPRPITDGILTFTAAQTGTVQIVGARRPRRSILFAENRGVAARDLNQAVNDITATLREMWDKTSDLTGRGLFFAPGNTTGPMPQPAACQGAYLAFDATGLNPLCVINGNGPSGFTAGNGILFSGTNPVTITNNIAAGNGIAITGTNPKTIANNIAAGAGITITGTNPLTIASSTVGGTPRIGNFRAANTVATPTVSMDLTADFVTFYNPSTGATNTIFTGLSKTCAINTFAAGGRDQAGAFTAGQTVWFYYIWGSGPGVNCVTSTAAPSTGPVLPATYTAYAAAFPVILVGSATLVPAAPQGSTVGGYIVRGNVVTYLTMPLLCAAAGTPCGFPTSNANVGTWIPSIAQETWYFIDIEAGNAAGTLLGGFLILGGTAVGVDTWSYGPGSLYVAVANIPAVNNAIIGPFPYPTSGNVQTIFCSAAGALGACASGTINTQATALIGVLGYSFAQ